MTIQDNSEAIEAWDGPLFERFARFRDIVTDGLGAHGERALQLHPPQPGDRVLDIGCGFGDTAHRIAGLVGPQGHVLGVDAAPRFIESARDEYGAANVRFEVADVERTTLGEGFDLAFSRFGTMFFANPVHALRNVREALRPGGRLCMVVSFRSARLHERVRCPGHRGIRARTECFPLLGQSGHFAGRPA
jgi:ubiquinone/menaquinone biosynthesis C-methylase UbiE